MLWATLATGAHNLCGKYVVGVVFCSFEWISPGAILCSALRIFGCSPTDQKDIRRAIRQYMVNFAVFLLKSSLSCTHLQPWQSNGVEFCCLTATENHWQRGACVISGTNLLEAVFYVDCRYDGLTSDRPLWHCAMLCPCTYVAPISFYFISFFSSFFFFLLSSLIFPFL